MAESLPRCAACSLCRDAAQVPRPCRLRGNYLTESQITYCVDVSYLSMCQLTLRQLGISNNACLAEAPVSMARAPPGFGAGFGAASFPPACGSPTDPPPSPLGKPPSLQARGWAGALRQLPSLGPRTDHRTFVSRAVPFPWELLKCC